MRCYCCSENSFSDCCEPVIKGQQPAQTPEMLMRSRYSAYCIGDYRYVLQTYDSKTQTTLTVNALAEHASENKWFALQIVPQHKHDCVEFKAYYFYQRRPHMLHETSRFIKESGRWVYTSGDLHSDFGKVAIGRNDACPCQSRKKFKQCCMKGAA